MEKKLFFVLLLCCVCFSLQAQRLVASFEKEFFAENSEKVSSLTYKLKQVDQTDLSDIDALSMPGHVYLRYRSNSALIYLLEKNYEFCLRFYFQGCDDHKIYLFNFDTVNGFISHNLITPTHAYRITNDRGFLKIYENSKEILNCFCYRLGNQMSIVPFNGTDVRVWGRPNAGNYSPAFKE